MSEVNDRFDIGFRVGFVLGAFFGVMTMSALNAYRGDEYEKISSVDNGVCTPTTRRKSRAGRVWFWLL